MADPSVVLLVYACSVRVVFVCFRKVVRQLKLDGMTDDEKTELIEEIKLQRDRVNHRYCMRISEVICEREIVNVITEYCEVCVMTFYICRPDRLAHPDYI